MPLSIGSPGPASLAAGVVFDGPGPSDLTPLLDRTPSLRYDGRRIEVGALVSRGAAPGRMAKEIAPTSARHVTVAGIATRPGAG